MQQFVVALVILAAVAFCSGNPVEDVKKNVKVEDTHVIKERAAQLGFLGGSGSGSQSQASSASESGSVGAGLGPLSLGASGSKSFSQSSASSGSGAFGGILG